MMQISSIVLLIININIRMIISTNGIPVEESKSQYSQLTRNIWPEDKECSKFTVDFGENLDLVYLVSYPRSGNTWIRYLIESYTGIYTGSVYEDKRQRDLGFNGEMEPVDTGRVVVVKTHAHSIPEDKWTFEQRFDHVPQEAPAILVIRNPLEAVLSFWSLRRASSQGQSASNFLAEDDIESLKTSEFHEFVQQNINRWKEIIQDRLIWSEKLLVVFYEKLKEDPVQEVRRMAKFLKFDGEDTERVQCIQRNVHGPSARVTNEKLNYFTTKEKMLAAYAMSSVSALLKLRGIQPTDSFKLFTYEYTNLKGDVGHDLPKLGAE